MGSTVTAGYDLVMALSGKALERFFRTLILERFAARGLPIELSSAGQMAFSATFDPPTLELLPRDRLTPFGQVTAPELLDNDYKRPVPAHALALDFPFANLRLALPGVTGTDDGPCAAGILSLMLPIGQVPPEQDGGEPRLGFDLSKAELWVELSPAGYIAPLVHGALESALTEQLQTLVADPSGAGADSGLAPLILPLVTRLQGALPGAGACPVTVVPGPVGTALPTLSVPTELLCTDVAMRADPDPAERLLVLAARLSPARAGEPVAAPPADLDLAWRRAGEAVTVAVANAFLFQDVLPPVLIPVMLARHFENRKILRDLDAGFFQPGPDAGDIDIDLPGPIDDQWPLGGGTEPPPDAPPPTEEAEAEDPDQVLWLSLVQTHFAAPFIIVEPVPFRFEGLPQPPHWRGALAGDEAIELPAGVDLTELGFAATNGFLDAVDVSVVTAAHPDTGESVGAVQLEIAVSGAVPASDIVAGYSFAGWVRLLVAFDTAGGRLKARAWPAGEQGVTVTVDSGPALPPWLVTQGLLGPLAQVLNEVSGLDLRLPLPLLLDEARLDDLVLAGDFDYRALLATDPPGTHGYDLIGCTPAGDQHWWLRLDAEADRYAAVAGASDARWRVAHVGQEPADASFEIASNRLRTRGGSLAWTHPSMPLWKALGLGLADLLDASQTPATMDIGMSLAAYPTAELDPFDLDAAQGHARVVGLCTASGRWALLLIWREGTALRTLYRRYPQTVRAQELLVDVRSDCAFAPGAKVDALDLPVVLPGKGGARVIGTTTLHVVTGRQQCRTEGTLVAALRRWTRPIQARWQVETLDGAMVDLPAPGVAEVALDATTAVDFEVDAVEATDAEAGYFGSRLRFRTRRGEGGSFRIHFEITEACAANGPQPERWSGSHVVSFRGARPGVLGLDRAVALLEESLNQLSGHAPGGQPAPIDPPDWGYGGHGIVEVGPGSDPLAQPRDWGDDVTLAAKRQMQQWVERAFGALEAPAARSPEASALRRAADDFVASLPTHIEDARGPERPEAGRPGLARAAGAGAAGVILGWILARLLD